MHLLRPYQEKAIQELRQQWQKNPILAIPTGGGKTVVATHIVKSSVERGNRVVFLVHREELIDQAATHFLATGHQVGIIKSGITPTPSAPIQVASVQTLVRRERPLAQVVIVDECFPAGTFVDGRRIETMRVGDLVTCYNHQADRLETKRVLRTFRSKPLALVRVHADGVPPIVCTPGHPFFTSSGNYVEATNLSGLWVAVHSKQLHREDLKQEVRHGSNPEVDHAAVRSMRSGRDMPGPRRPRCSEARTALAWARVDRVEVLEPGSDGQFGGVCPDGHVYNLEVEEHHNYFAEGFLVHNCHHACANSYQTILNDYTDACKIGLTATPFRLDGKGLGAAGFGAIVVVATPNQLIRDGYLLRPRYFVSPHPPDLSGVRTVAGEYHLGELGMAMNNTTLIGDILEHWKRHAEGRATICFASSVEHSKAIVDRFGAAGITAEHIDGTTPKEERQAIIEAFRDGDLTILSNYAIVTEGFDVPEASICIMARPTQSLALYLQCVGRIMRPAEGKEQPILLDHARCIERHGLPTDLIEFNLEDRIKKSATSVLASFWTCKSCFAVNESTDNVCQECGAEKPERKRKPKRTEQADLVELTEDLISERRRAEQEAFYRHQLMVAARRGHKIGWARYRFKNKFHHWPRLYALEREHYKPYENMSAHSLALRFGEDKFKSVTGKASWCASWKEICEFAAVMRKEESVAMDPFAGTVNSVAASSLPSRPYDPNERLADDDPESFNFGANAS